jgi:hypothetical protein
MSARLNWSRQKRDLRKAKLDGALKRWKAGFPVDINSSSWSSLICLYSSANSMKPDPVKRKENYLEEAKKAREHGFTKLATSLYDQAFAVELFNASLSVNKDKVRKDFLAKSSNVEKIDKALKDLGEKFQKTDQT